MAAEKKTEEGQLPDLEAPKSQVVNRDEVDAPSSIGMFGIPLYSYHEIPSFLKGNPYITEGYRAHLPFALCVKSAFMCTNETVNIWSHLLGLLYFMFLTLHDNFFFLPQNRADFGDHLTFTILDICFQVCMFCSAGYHMFVCHSELVSKRWLSLDLAGVSVGLCGCYFPGAYYAFYCDTFWQTAYMLAMSVLSLASLFAQVHPKFLSNHWYMRRLFLYAALMFAGIVPVLHWVVGNGGFSDPLVQIFLPKIIVMYSLAVIGGTFYLSKFPEKWFPGKVNFIGSSHQWWHLMVVIAFAYTHHIAVVIFLYWRVHKCPSSALTLSSAVDITVTVDR